jgi:hypothetical protein
MPGVDAFDRNARQYEVWFDVHPFPYLSELHAAQELLPTAIKEGFGKGSFVVIKADKQFRTMGRPPLTGKTSISLVKASDREFIMSATEGDRDRDGR